MKNLLAIAITLTALPLSAIESPRHRNSPCEPGQESIIGAPVRNLDAACPCTTTTISQNSDNEQFGQLRFYELPNLNNY